MNVEVSGASRADTNEGELARFAASILRGESVDDGASLSITFLDSDAIADLNARYMARTGPTDVLSFPIEDAAPDNPPVPTPDGPPLELGDIFICEKIVDTHAAEYDVSFDSELHLMVVHGVLHILGWDHQTGAEAEAMEEREEQHLASIGRERR